MKYLSIYFRAAENPFLLSAFEFKKQFRLSKVCVKYIINTIRPYMSTSNRKSSISIERKVSEKKNAMTISYNKSSPF